MNSKINQYLFSFLKVEYLKIIFQLHDSITITK